jgi:hypothetical protein
VPNSQSLSSDKGILSGVRPRKTSPNDETPGKLILGFSMALSSFAAATIRIAGVI